MKKEIDDKVTEKQIGSVSQGMFWKLIERFGVTGIQFVLQIVLARLLGPEHYGVLSILLIFITLANVFVQNGFNTALIQNKDVTDEDYSSVFWVSLFISILLYILLFFSAPFIADFYSMPEITVSLRVLAIMLFPGTLNSIQLAKVSREMNFKKVFYSNIGGVIISGIIGIVVAYSGGGLWALIVQSIVNVFVASIVMHFTIDFKVRLVCNFRRVRVLFQYGWKLLASSLIDTIFNEVRSLIIGKKYDSETVGYYNRGKHFPQFIINAVNGAVQSVMLPAMSAEQDNITNVKKMARYSIMLSSYIIFPIMAGLAAVSTSLISLILTDKWLPCVPYMQIYCFILAFYPIHSCNLQAINAMGRSDVFLKLEIIKKIIGIMALIFVVIVFDSPIAIAMTGVFTAFTSSFINSYPNKKLIKYSYLEQIIDVLPSIILSCLMYICVLGLGTVKLPLMMVLIVQIIIGMLIYFLLSWIFKLKPYMIIMKCIKEFAKMKK